MPSIKTYAPVRMIEVGTTGVKIQVEVNRQTGEFSATFARQRYQGGERNLADFIEYLTKKVTEGMDVKWKDVIMVKMNDSGYGSTRGYTVGYDLTRLHVVCIASQWKKLAWNGVPGPESMDKLEDYNEFRDHYDRMERNLTPEELTFPYLIFPYHWNRSIRDNNSVENATEVVLEYSEDLWKGLSLLRERIKDLRQQLMQLLGSNDNLARIALIGAEAMKLLPAPASKEEVEA